MKVRRVVTGHDKKGRSVFASDQQVDPVVVKLLPGREFHRLWGGDAAPSFPDDGSPTAQPTYFPPVGGYRFGFFTLLPAGTTAPDDLDLTAALAEAEESLPGAMAHMDPSEPGMHTTDTIDFEVVLSGEIVLELSDGSEATLRQGDTVVQNGTRHRWHNQTGEPAVVAVFIVGAHRTKGP